MKHINVGDQYRTNPMSLMPGGSSVTVYKNDGLVLIYDKIKMPRRYIAKLKFKEDIVRVDVNGENVWVSTQSGPKYWEQND